MSELLLYHAIPSRALVVHWMLEEIGEPYELKILDLSKDEQKRPEFLALNPMGTVPVLCHGDRVVTETAAICVYLSEVFPDAGLGVAPDSPLRGDFLRWMFFAPVTAEPAVLWKALGDQVAAIEQQPFADLDLVASTLRDAIGDKQFIVGNRFTAADIMLGSTLYWGLKLMPVMPKHPELVSYWNALEQRTAWQKVLSSMAT